MSKGNKRARRIHMNSSTESNTGVDFTADLHNLKNSVAQLKDDVSGLLDNAVGAGKSGMGAVRDKTGQAVGQIKDQLWSLKHRGERSLEDAEHSIEQHPLVS